MRISTLLTGKTPNPNYTGALPADMEILAIDVSDEQLENVDNYVLAYDGVTTISGTINPSTSTKTYFSGTKTTRTGTARAYAVSGDRIAGDEFQDYILSHAVKFGIGSNVTVKYVSFNLLTGVGEKGTCTISVSSDKGGNAGDTGTFAVDITAEGTPEAYSYTEAAAE